MAQIILEDTVWSSGQIINLTEDVQIAHGVTLTIEPDVRVNGNGHEIMAFGSLIAGQPGTTWGVEFVNADFSFGSSHNTPGRIEIYNSEIHGGSFLGASGHASYGSFKVHNSSFEYVDGFYIWYPTSDSEFWGNTFSYSRGLSIGTDNTVNIQNNAFFNPYSAINGESTIVSWRSSESVDLIRVVNNTFYSGTVNVLEVADGYSRAYLYADGNFIEGATGTNGESFVLDNQDSLTRASDINLGEQAAEPHDDTPEINRPTSGWGYVSGTEYEGNTLTAYVSTPIDPDGAENLSYQWVRNGEEIGGATEGSYTLTQEDVGAHITLQIRYDDPGRAKYSEITSETRSLEVTAANTAGGNSSFQLRFATSVPDGESLLQFGYFATGWRLTASDDWPGNLSPVDVGEKVVELLEGEGIRTYSDAAEYFNGVDRIEPFSQSLFVDSLAELVINVNDAPTGNVVVAGEARQGEALMADTTSLADEDGLGSLSYQWQRDGADIFGATSQTYTLTQEDVGTAVSVRVSYTDGHGALEAITSDATAAVRNVNDAPTGAVTISGRAVQGRTLSASNTLDDADGLGPVNYQWQRDGEDIEGATGETYTLTGRDSGAEITVQALYTDDFGAVETVLSAPTPQVRGNMYLFGNAGDNELTGGRFNDRLSGRAGDDTLTGRSGADALLGGIGEDNISGGAGRDTVKGHGGDDELAGNSGNDRLVGGGGNDNLLGGGGNDSIAGGGGRDRIQGQKGVDVLTGGAGRDTFVFNRGDGQDSITDFELGIDLIGIGRGASRMGQLDFQQHGDDVSVSFRNVEITVENLTVDELLAGDHFSFA